MSKFQSFTFGESFNDPKERERRKKLYKKLDHINLDFEEPFSAQEKIEELQDLLEKARSLVEELKNDLNPQPMDPTPR